MGLEGKTDEPVDEQGGEPVEAVLAGTQSAGPTAPSTVAPGRRRWRSSAARALGGPARADGPRSPLRSSAALGKAPRPGTICFATDTAAAAAEEVDATQTRRLLHWFAGGKADQADNHRARTCGAALLEGSVQASAETFSSLDVRPRPGHLFFAGHGVGKGDHAAPAQWGTPPHEDTCDIVTGEVGLDAGTDSYIRPAESALHIKKGDAAEAEEQGGAHHASDNVDNVTGTITIDEPAAEPTTTIDAPALGNNQAAVVVSKGSCAGRGLSSRPRGPVSAAGGPRLDTGGRADNAAWATRGKGKGSGDVVYVDEVPPKPPELPAERHLELDPGPCATESAAMELEERVEQRAEDHTEQEVAAQGGPAAAALAETEVRASGAAGYGGNEVDLFSIWPGGMSPQRVAAEKALDDARRKLEKAEEKLEEAEGPRTGTQGRADVRPPTRKGGPLTTASGGRCGGAVGAPARPAGLRRADDSYDFEYFFLEDHEFNDDLVKGAIEDLEGCIRYFDGWPTAETFVGELRDQQMILSCSHRVRLYAALVALCGEAMDQSLLERFSAHIRMAITDAGMPTEDICWAIDAYYDAHPMCLCDIDEVMWAALGEGWLEKNALIGYYRRGRGAGEPGFAAARRQLFPFLKWLSRSTADEARREHSGPGDQRDEKPRGRRLSAASTLSAASSHGPTDVFVDGGPACYNCGELGHKAIDCVRPRECGRCGSFDHASSWCPHAHKVCYVCGLSGHLGHKCRNVRLARADWRGGLSRASASARTGIG